MQPEAKITRAILRRLKQEGGWWAKVHGGPFQVAGLPDIIGLREGVFYGIEVKCPGKLNTLTALQKHTLSVLRKNGGVCGVVTSVGEALALLE